MKQIEFTAYGAPVVGYLHEDHYRLEAHKVRPAMIVCPGGGYYLISPREADDPAMEFFTQGYNVFILTYSILEKAPDFRPLRELAQTVSIVRENSTAWHIDPARIAVMGFSAGGHLVATLGTKWNDSALSLPADCRPDALVLCYPVITMGEFTHIQTRDNITGFRPELRDTFSAEKHITGDFPPSFVWHTVDDNSVPVENSLLLIAQLRKAGVPFECHLFAHGEHGISTCTQEVETPNPECREWVQLCKTWLNNRFEFTP